MCIVPAAAPSNLLLLNNDSVLSWTPLDGVCGYVVYAYSLLMNKENSVFVSNNIYNVTQDDDLLAVRGYSDLLGPASQITVNGKLV